MCTEAKSDLINVLSSLEAHWHVLEAEVVEINRDIDYCEQCLRKYGEWFNSPLQYLRVSADISPNSSSAFSFRFLLMFCAGVETCQEEQNVCIRIWNFDQDEPLSIHGDCCFRCTRRKEIIRTMESFNNNLQGGKRLVKSLEKQTVQN